MIGWIKLHRKLTESSKWVNSTPEQKVILVTLITMANHSPKEWEWKGEPYVCERGQLITSLESMF